MFTDRFRYLLQLKKMTAYRIAKDTGISQGLMAEYNRGEKIPTVNNLIKIADYLDCSVDYLLGNTDEKKPAQDWKQGTGLPDILYRFSELSDSRQKEVVEFVEFKLAQQEKDNS